MKVLITTSTFPATDSDKVPAFVKDQAIELKKRYPTTKILIHAPHNHYAKTAKLVTSNRYYQEFRYHYFWPRRWELLTGRGIMPALHQNRLLYFQIPFLFVCQFFSLLSLTRKAQPDIIYAHWFTPQAITGALVSKLTNTPMVFTTHASDVDVLRKVPFSKRVVNWVCNQAAAYTAVSERTAGRLKAFWGTSPINNDFSSKLNIIPMGIRLNSHPPTKNDIKATLAKYNLPRDKFFLLFIGRLAEIKGIKYLIQALPKLPEPDRQRLHLVIAGDGHIEPELRHLAKQLKVTNLTFTGFVYGDDKYRLLALADAICMPSIIDGHGHREGLPVVIMEALAAGKPVLASNVAGADGIIVSGQNGLVFAEKSVSSLAEAISIIMNMNQTDREAMKRKARQAAYKFYWGKIIPQYNRIFNEVARK